MALLTNVPASQEHKEKASLSILKDKLLPDGYDPSITLVKYSSDVMESFKNPGRLSLLNFDRLINERVFKEWEESSRSCILLLHGRTAITTRDYSWLSPATFRLVESYRAENRLVLFHCVHDKVHMEQDIPAHVVLSSLVYQLLSARLSILRDQPQFEDLSRKISDPKWRTPPPKAPFAVLRELLDKHAEAYIFLDRIDRIKGDPDRFMDPLVDLVKQSRCRIKVFLVASSNNFNPPEGKLTQDVLADIEDRAGSGNFLHLMLNQK